jgi:hypothetical protein
MKLGTVLTAILLTIGRLDAGAADPSTSASDRWHVTGTLTSSRKKFNSLTLVQI